MRWWVAVLFVAACRFDESGGNAGSGGSAGVGGGGMGGAGGTGGGGTGGTGGTMNCTGSCSQIAGEIRVNGQVWTSNSQPAVFRIVGDTISLDTSAVCTPSGQTAYTWSAMPATVAIAPSPNTASILLYATDPGEYHVTLHIADPGCTSATPLDVTVWGFTAIGPLAVATNTFSSGSNQINDVAAGAGKIWVATADGAWRTDLAPPRAGWENLQTVYPQNPFITTNLFTVFFDAPDNLLWFAGTGTQAAVQKILLTGTSIDTVDVATNAAHDLLVWEFSKGAGPVHLASDRGIMDWNGAAAFVNIRQVGNDALAAITELAGQPLWAGGQALDNFSAVPPTSTDIFQGGDDKIRALALDGAHLWIGGDGFGLARASATTGTVDDTLTMMTPAPRSLPGNKIRDIAVDGQDVWMATDQGIARYKQDASAVVSYKRSVPGPMLSGAQLDTRGIVVDRSSGVRRVIAGTAGGVLVLETPP